MVSYSYGDSGEKLAVEWHKLRFEAVFETYDIDKEFGPIEKERGDLDELETRRGSKDSTYITETRIDTEGGAQSGIDIRTVDDIRD